MGDAEDQQGFHEASEAKELEKEQAEGVTMVEELERVYTIPLNVTKVVPKTSRAPRAIKEIKDFVRRHMMEEVPTDEKEKGAPKDVWVDYKLNELIWARGIENPPAKVRVKAIRFEDGLIEVSLPEEE